MKHLFTLILLTSVAQVLWGQGSISGRVVSSTNKKGIAYAAVYLTQNKTGVYTDEYGYFRIECSYNPLPEDTLLIEHISFKRGIYSAKEIKSVSDRGLIILKLDPVHFQIAEVVITAQKGRIAEPGKVKGKARGHQYSSWGSHHQTARFISLGQYAGKKIKLKKIKYFVTKDGKPKAPFGVRLYAFNDSTGMPGKELLTQRIVMQATKRNSWAVANLDSLNIFLPSEGVFAAMEWLPVHEEFIHERIHNPRAAPSYGQVLGMTQEVKENQFYMRSGEGKWFRTETNTGLGFTSNPMIYLEIEIFD